MTCQDVHTPRYYQNPSQSSNPPSTPPSHHTIIGIDTSTSTSCAVLLTLHGRLLRTVYGQALNPRILGFDSSATALSNLIQRSLPPPNKPVRIVAIALAGAHLQSLRNRYAAHIRQTVTLPSFTRVIIANEALSPMGLVVPAVFHGDLTHIEPRIIVLVASVDTVTTSCSICENNFVDSTTDSLLHGDKYIYKVNKICGSWGSILGADGSTYAVAIKVLRTALRIIDGRASMVVKKLLNCGAIAFCHEDEAKALAGTVLYAALAHFSIRADDIEDGVARLAAHLNNNKTSRFDIASLTAVLSSLAATGHGLCKQAFADAGRELGSSLMDTLRGTTMTERGTLQRTAVCAAGDMFNAWREVPDFANAFRGALTPFLEAGGHVFLPKRSISRPEMLTGGGPELAYGCAHAAAMVSGLTGEEWAQFAAAYLHKI